MLQQVGQIGDTRYDYSSQPNGVWLDRFNCCKCDKCKKDIAALALNRLKPRYVVMKEGDQEKRSKAELENGSEVTGALVQAILVVKKEPWH